MVTHCGRSGFAVIAVKMVAIVDLALKPRIASETRRDSWSDSTDSFDFCRVFHWLSDDSNRCN